MKPKDWYLRVMVTLLVIGVWVLIFKPVLAPTPSKAAAAEKVVRADRVYAKEVHARRFAVVNDQGVTRAVLELAVGDEPRLMLITDGKQGTRTAMAALTKSGLVLFGEDASNGTGINLRVAADEPPCLRLVYNTGLQAELGVHNDVVALALEGKEGIPHARIEVPLEGEPTVSLRDKEWKTLFSAP